MWVLLFSIHCVGTLKVTIFVTENITVFLLFPYHSFDFSIIGEWLVVCHECPLFQAIKVHTILLGTRGIASCQENTFLTSTVRKPWKHGPCK